MTKHTNYSPTMGVEVHVQIANKLCVSKLFSHAASSCYMGDPNTNITLFDYGVPGTLPSLNEAVKSQAVRAALALNCHINQESQWDYKNYMYPDMPNGRQITQYYRPIATNGHLRLISSQEEPVLINRIHIEQDAGSSKHDIYPEYTAVDFNRAGVALLEIVTEPCIKSVEQLISFVKTLRATLRNIGVSNCDMEKGELRTDLSISINLPGQPLGTRVEVKNLNSFTFLQKAAMYEFDRQSAILNSGQQVDQETRLFDPKTCATRSMRSKEDAAGYMYLHNHDLPNLIVTQELIDQTNLPLSPSAFFQLLLDQKVPFSYASTLALEPEYMSFFNSLNLTPNHMPDAARLIVEEVFALAKDDLYTCKAEWIHEILELLNSDRASHKTAKTLLEIAFETGESPKHAIISHKLEQISDTESIRQIITQIFVNNPNEVARYKSGETKLIKFFAGQVFKNLRSANPRIVEQMIIRELHA